MKMMIAVLVLLTIQRQGLTKEIDWNAPLLQGQVPSRLSYAAAVDLHKKVKRGIRSIKSQCYNRAHVWAYQVQKHAGVKTIKAFMLYTPKHMEENNSDWWFHVAPAIQIENESRIFTLDYFYSDDRPWGLPVCKVISRYSEYTAAVQKDEKECFILYTSSYFITPDDLEKFEQGLSPAPQKFDEREVKRSMRQAFLPPWRL